MELNEFAHRTEFFSFNTDIDLNLIIDTVSKIKDKFFSHCELDISFSSLKEHYIHISIDELQQLYMTSFPNIGSINFDLRGDVTSFSLNLQYNNQSVGPNGNYAVYAGSVDRNREIEKIITQKLPLKKPKSLIADNNQMVVSPIFTNRDFKDKDKYCFVLMPFTLDWSNRVYKQVRTIVNEIGYNCERADNLYGKNILEDIWTAINEAEIIVADVTAQNANVFYEIGIAHTLGKKVILLTQNIADIPFDFKGYRHIVYQDNVDGFETLKSSIHEYFK
ncbi:MAG TPA: hypothetical protein PKH16_00010 [Aequorivita sp.]|nr:hypothetical protein [Aequorivita sp.]